MSPKPKYYASFLLTALQEVENEVMNSKKKFPDDFNSSHEGLAVLEEEYLELRDQIFWGLKQEKLAHDHWVKVREEARQVCAMALRIMVELT